MPKMLAVSFLLLAVYQIQAVAAFIGHRNFQLKTPRDVPGLQRYHELKQQEQAAATAQPSLTFQNLDTGSSEPSSPPVQALADQYPAYNFTQPLDHFDPKNNVTFEMRYWMSTRHYKPPSGRDPAQKAVLYVLDSGETNAEGRIPFLDHGILDILANATGGIGIVLEHRYYGKSYPPRSAIEPVSPYWDTDSLRFLNNSQALEDSAEFVRKVQLPGIDEPISNFTVISYGGSYPGARSAHLRVLYPDLFYGAIASSAVTEAIESFPEYFYPIARGSDPACSQAIQAAIAGFDEAAIPASKLEHHKSYNVKADAALRKARAERNALLDIFGVQNLTHVADLANVLVSPLGMFQALNWDPQVSIEPGWSQFCEAMTSSNNSRALELEKQGEKHKLPLFKETYRLAAYIRENGIDGCMRTAAEGDDDAPSRADQCFGTEDWSRYTQATSLSAGISWPYQTCLNWGYFQAAPSVAHGRSAGPKLISSLITLEYSSEVCRKGYPPGKANALPAHPDVEEVNRLGGFALSFPRLAFIDGQYDPWRPATPHSEEFAFGGARSDTLDRPFKVIPNCWHHCDEGSVPADQRDDEPERIKAIHAQEVQFVKHWLS